MTDNLIIFIVYWYLPIALVFLLSLAILELCICDTAIILPARGSSIKVFRDLNSILPDCTVYKIGADFSLKFENIDVDRTAKQPASLKFSLVCLVHLPSNSFLLPY